MAGPSRMDVSYPPESDEIWKRDQIRSLMMTDPDLGFPLDASKRSNRKRLGASGRLGSDTYPKAKSNEPKSPKAMTSSEPKAARVTFTLPYRPCDICSMDHPGSRCSYWEYVPQGSTVGPGYKILCRGCCSDFIIEKWVCSFCGAKQGKVFLKYCSVCHTHGQHNTDECPEDKVTAATHKFLRERRRQVKVLVPVKPSYVPPPPLPGSVPVKPSYVLPHVPGYVATSPF